VWIVYKKWNEKEYGKNDMVSRMVMRDKWDMFDRISSKFKVLLRMREMNLTSTLGLGRRDDNKSVTE